MGMCGEACSTEHGFTREDQDNYAINSYKKAAAAWEKGLFNEEVVPITIKSKKGDIIVSKDEEFSNFNLSKMSTLKSAFKKDGTITAANASKLNDGAAAMVVVSGKVCKDLGLTPLFRVKGFGDAARAPVEFTIAPSDAVPRAFKMAGVTNSDIDLHEINEAFSVVPLVNAKLLGLDLDKVNVHGGAVALGHPIGCSGARIIISLYHALKANDKTLGCASICNGGGGASAIVIERLN